MAVLVQCRKHPQYMGQKYPKAKVKHPWLEDRIEVCGTCIMLYELVHGGAIESGEDGTLLVASAGRKGEVSS
jgi:hypothetical protein